MIVRPSLPLAALLALALLPAGCGGCFTKTEAHVDVPTTIEEVKKLHSPPGVEVRVERKERKGGSGGGCGHSALCIVVFPILIYGALFPEKWDQVTVTESGKITYEGRFETGGKLIEATARKDGLPHYPDYVSIARDVIARGLVLAGCKQGEVLEAARSANAVKDSDRGPLCTR